MALLPVSEAIRLVTEGLEPLEAERVPLAEALGRVLAEDLQARLTQPPFPASAMDGFAVRSEDVASLPATLASDRRVGRRTAFRRRRLAQAKPFASLPARRCPLAPTASSFRRMSICPAISPPSTPSIRNASFGPPVRISARAKSCCGPARCSMRAV